MMYTLRVFLHVYGNTRPGMLKWIMYLSEDLKVSYPHACPCPTGSHASPPLSHHTPHSPITHATL